jgi:hypothetical protein
VRFAGAILTMLQVAPLAVSAQGPVVLSGRVLEFGTRSGISGATVAIPSIGLVTTGASGEFRLPPMAAGERVVTISALGYQTRELHLELQRDTTIVVELEVQALRIDSLRVDVRTITVRGSVSDRLTLEPVFDADVAIAGSKFGSSNIAGNFKVRSVPASVSVRVSVRGPGYLPYSTTITAERDTTLRIQLEIDPIGQRLLAEQMERLRKRSQGVNARLTQWNRDRLAITPREMLGDFLKHHFVQGVTCFFVDDMDRSSWLPDVLASFVVDELDRIEVYDRGLMLRIYTRRYIAKQSNNKKLPSIVYMRIGRGKPVCM